MLPVRCGGAHGRGLFRLAAGVIESAAAAGVPPEATIIYNLQASTGTAGERTMWASTRGGVLRVRGDQAELYDRRHGLSSNVVRWVHLWRSPAGVDVLWAATEAWRRADGDGRQLVGFEPTGGPWTAENHRAYGVLPPGRYLLRVEARDYGGLHSEPVEVPIEVVPAWWQRLELRVAAGAFLAAAAALFYFRRVRQLIRQREALELTVASRTSELADANERLAKLAQEDPLTGVANRRRFDRELDEEWRRGQRMGTPFGLLMIDVDCFKAYNDALGHPAGDICLRAIAATLARAFAQAGELVARYGGEEFVILIPGLSRESSLVSAENSRRQIAELGLPHPDSTAAPVVTVSVGVAWERPTFGSSPYALIEGADRALYRAKQDGRNCVREA